jgi:hypothetical protein
MDYDRWKTTPPEYIECDDCGTIIDARIARKATEFVGGNGKPLCPACHRLYDPRIP